MTRRKGEMRPLLFPLWRGLNTPRYLTVFNRPPFKGGNHLHERLLSPFDR
jgi:hypothetical protein